MIKSLVRKYHKPALTAVLVVILLALLFAMMITADAVTLFEDGSATFAGRNLGCIVRAWGCS